MNKDRSLNRENSYLCVFVRVEDSSLPRGRYHSLHHWISKDAIGGKLSVEIRTLILRRALNRV